MQTLPSIEAVPMWIEFDGVAATVTCLELCFWPGADEKLRLGLGRASEASRLTVSTLAIGRGGGNGDIDTAETLAEWAW